MRGVEAEAAESADATGTEININNQDNKRAAEESGGASQQPSASKKKQRRTKRTSGGAQRARKRSAHEAYSESDEREAGGERQKGNLKMSE